MQRAQHVVVAAQLQQASCVSSNNTRLPNCTATRYDILHLGGIQGIAKEAVEPVDHTPVFPRRVGINYRSGRDAIRRALQDQQRLNGEIRCTFNTELPAGYRRHRRIFRSVCRR